MVMPLIIILVVKFINLNETSNLLKLYRVTNDNIIAYTPEAPTLKNFWGGPNGNIIACMYTNTYQRAHTHTESSRCATKASKHSTYL